MLTENSFASVKLFHPSGAIVTVPLPTDSSVISANVAQALVHSVNNLIDAGFVVTEADRANADEADICAVVRGQVTNERGQTTDRIYMYSPRLKYKALTVYMNDSADAAKFEHYSGLRIADLPIIEGKAAPEQDDPVYRAKSRPTSFKVLRKKEGGPNDDPKDTPWKLVRYLGSATDRGQPANAPQGAQNAPQATGPVVVANPMADAFKAVAHLYDRMTDEDAKKETFRGDVARLQATGKLNKQSSAQQIIDAIKFDLLPAPSVVGK